MSATRRDPGLTRERLLAESLAWAVGFIRCHHPMAAADYPDMRQAAELVAAGGGLVTGPYQMAEIRAEVAEDQLATLSRAAAAVVERAAAAGGEWADIDRLKDAIPADAAPGPDRPAWLSAFDLRLAMRRAAEDLTNIRPLPAWIEYPVAAVAANLTAAAGPATADVVAAEGCARRTAAELRRVRAECGRLAMLLSAAAPPDAPGPVADAVDALLDLAVTPREVTGVKPAPAAAPLTHLDPAGPAYAGSPFVNEMMAYAWAAAYDRVGACLTGHRGVTRAELAEFSRMMAYGYAAAVLAAPPAEGVARG